MKRFWRWIGRRESGAGKGWPASACALALVAALPSGLLAAQETAPASPEVRLLVAVLPAEGSVERRVAFVAEFPTAGLESEEGGFAGELRLRVVDASGAERRSVGEPFALADTGSDGQPLAGVKLFGEIELAPGAYDLEARLQSSSGRQLATTRTAVAVPSTDTVAWVASPALAFDERPGWRAFRAASLPASGLPFPFTRPDGGDFLPRAGAELRSGRGAELLVLLAATGGGFPDLKAEVRLAGGGAPIQAPLELESVMPSRMTGVTVASVRIDLPERIGRAELRIGFVGGGETTTLPVQLVTPSQSAMVAGDEAGDASVGDMAVVSPGSLEAGYLDLLRRLGSEGPQATAPALAEFERAATAFDRGARMRQLRDAEEETARRVAARDPEVWKAILALHVEADSVYTESRDPWLVAQGRRFVGRLVKIGRMARDPESRAFAADALSLLAPNAALELDGKHPLALLRVGIALERSFRFQEAAAMLRRLVASHPDDLQARLRLGVNLRRLGELESASRELRGVWTSTAVPWVREMACSELARLEHDRGRREAAERVLTEGIEALGAEQLYLQLAYYLEERNRSREAVQWVNRMPVEEGQERASARHLYAQDPDVELAAVRERVRGRAEVARAAMVPALGTAAGGGS